MRTTVFMCAVLVWSGVANAIVVLNDGRDDYQLNNSAFDRMPPARRTSGPARRHGACYAIPHMKTTAGVEFQDTLVISIGGHRCLVKRRRH